MTRRLTPLILAAALAAPLPAAAKGPAHCPPGLAKKIPACIPPGLAGTTRAEPRPGDSGPWVRVTENVVVRVTDGSRALIDIIRLADVVLSD
jgi:hypothetical protein